MRQTRSMRGAADTLSRCCPSFARLSVSKQAQQDDEEQYVVEVVCMLKLSLWISDSKGVD